MICRAAHRPDPDIFTNIFVTATRERPTTKPRTSRKPVTRAAGTWDITHMNVPSLLFFQYPVFLRSDRCAPRATPPSPPHSRACYFWRPSAFYPSRNRSDPDLVANLFCIRDAGESHAKTAKFEEVCSEGGRAGKKRNTHGRLAEAVETDHVGGWGFEKHSDFGSTCGGPVLGKPATVRQVVRQYKGELLLTQMLQYNTV